MSSSTLVEAVPRMKELLRPYTRGYAAVVSQVLRPHFNGYNLEAEDTAYVGGEPLIIQQPHEPLCVQCHEPMRFLFQFGDVIPGVPMAKGDIFSVYGCDNPPEQCKDFVDTY